MCAWRTLAELLDRDDVRVDVDDALRMVADADADAVLADALGAARIDR